MSLLRRAFERRSNLNDPNVPLSPAAIQALFTMPNTDAGVVVSAESSLKTAVVWRCVNLLANVAASVPLRAYERDSLNPVANALLDSPHPELTPFEFWRLTYAHRMMYGNHYSEKIRDGSNRIKWLAPLVPDQVKVGRANDGLKVFEVTRKDGTTDPRTTNEIFHLPGFGYDGLIGLSPIGMAAQAIGLSMSAEKFGAKLFGSGTMLSGILTADQTLTQQQAEVIKERWKAKMTGPDAAWDVAVLDSGAKFQPMSMPNRDAQFIESRGFQVQEIARMFGIPPHLVGDVVRSTSWGTGIEQQAIGFVKFTVQPDWLVPTEQRITKELLQSPTTYARYNIDDLLRGDAVSRAEYYRTMREIGAMSANDVRADEKLPPVPGGDVYMQPMNMEPLGTKPSATPGKGSE